MHVEYLPSIKVCGYSMLHFTYIAFTFRAAMFLILKCFLHWILLKGDDTYDQQRGCSWGGPKLAGHAAGVSILSCPSTTSSCHHRPPQRPTAQLQAVMLHCNYIAVKSNY